MLKYVEDNTDWWLEERWTTCSVKQNWGLSFYLYFLVDLQYEGNDKGSAVWAVSASANVVRSHIEAQKCFANVFLQKGRIDKSIALFIDAINDYRNSID